MTTLVQARIDVAFHDLATRIYANAEEAKSRLCGTSSTTSDRQPIFTGYTYVAGARIEYDVALPMYDDYPWVEECCYHVSRSVYLKFPAMGLIQAREHIGATWETARAKVESISFQNDNCLDEDWNESGYITAIKLLDTFGNVVDTISNRSLWIQDLQVIGDVKSMKERIAALRNESALERGWDNHDTARSLSSMADSIADQISIIECRSRLVA
ncbi:hypothetical protein ABQW72_00560 [Xanthomonas hortorum pv. pelargonii]|uniref:hypothetical protein n=1 Tax=Xanthomonas hortorum TaxID=56454 RepID=UPI0021C7F29D|nr:hypothetical protein [Xanthomonas hortorum]MCU1710222.1 hypothetical protein [Xanthomonas hortorum pv. pelargonii]WCI07340.1 hypothetical protein PML25_22340 [Xanthomonas hortorum pv. pelargonii]WOB33106.1 hypothetical protein NYR98_22365 [Xanthomonas hortorum pv. pelargonii]